MSEFSRISVGTSSNPLARPNRDLHDHVAQDQRLWVDPFGFRGALLADDRWIISGRKGSGKTAVVERVKEQMNTLLREVNSEFHQRCVVETIRLDIPEVHEQIVAANQDEGLSGLDTVVDRVVERYMFHEIMRVLEDAGYNRKYHGGGSYGPGGSEADKQLRRIRTYLTGKRITKSFRMFVDWVHAAIKGVGEYLRAPSAADKILTRDYRHARYALEQYIQLATEELGFLFCIDNLDTHGFRYDDQTRSICEAVVNFCMRYNDAHRGNNRNSRIWLCIPSEIFRTLSLWNSQEVSRRTFVLHWSTPGRLRNLINLRLESKCDDLMKDLCVEAPDSWSQIFPEKITNFRGVEEDTFSYLVRHTYYLPKDIIEITEYVIHEVSSLRRDGASEIDWHQRFQQAVRTFTQRKAGWIVDLYDQVYPGFKDLVFRLTKMPAIMSGPDFERRLFDAGEASPVRDRQSKANLSDEKLLRVLYLAGVIGQLDDQIVIDGEEAFHLNFAYYHIGGKVPQPDIQFGRSRPENRTFVVSPVFNHVLNVQPHSGTVIAPHKPLLRSHLPELSRPPSARV